jgi:agmatine deiminase
VASGSRDAAGVTRPAVAPTRRVPLEAAPHERTLIAWPTETRRDALWGDLLEAARDAHASVARTVVAHEPVTMIANPDEVASAAATCGPAIEIVAAAIDDSWIRDTGPIISFDADDRRVAVHFGFNAWGKKYAPYDHDATIGARIAARLGLRVEEVPLVLEGGSIAMDGNGLLVTTERCLLNPNRNPGATRANIEAALRAALGVERIVWLADGIAEDAETDGHVDNVVAFVAPGRVVLQGCDDPANPNHAIAADNRARLVAAGITIVEVPTLPYVDIAGEHVPVPYVNWYVANGVVVVPVTGEATDAATLELVGTQYPGRSVVGVDGAVLAYGGGGVHCITQPVPAAPSLARSASS